MVAEAAQTEGWSRGDSGPAQQEVDLETDVVGDAQDHGDPGDAESEVLEAEGRPRANPDLRPVEARRRVPGDPARRVPDGQVTDQRERRGPARREREAEPTHLDGSEHDRRVAVR